MKTPFDPAVLARLAELNLPGFPDFGEELVGDFFREGGGLVNALQKAVAERQFQDWEERAHALRSSAGLVGFLELEGLFGELEQAARQRREDPPALARLADAFLRARAAWAAAQSGSEK